MTPMQQPGAAQTADEPAIVLWLAETVDVVILSEETQVRPLGSGQAGFSIMVGSEQAERFFNAAATTGVKDDVSANSTEWSELYQFGVSKRILLAAPRTVSRGFQLICFTPTQLMPGLFLMRVGCLLFRIPTRAEGDLARNLEHLARGWISEEDRRVVLCLLESPSKIAVVSASFGLDLAASAATLSSLPKYLPTRLSISGKSFVDTGVAYNPISSEAIAVDSYWNFLIGWASKRSEVTLLQPMTGQKPPFHLEGFAYQAAHRLHRLTEDKTQFAFGTGADAGEAAGKATMEALERSFSQASIPFVCFESERNLREQGQAYLPGTSFLHYSDLQKASSGFNGAAAKYDAYVPIHWCRITPLTEGEDILVPRDIVTYGDRFDLLDERPIFDSNSSGCAGRRTLDDALLCGVRELIERDALLSWWFGRVTPPRVLSVHFGPSHTRIHERLECLGYEVIALDLTLDSLPVVLAACRRRDGRWPYFFCGAGCDLDIAVALRKALDELQLACWTWIGAPRAEPPRLEDIREPLHHELWYLEPGNRNGVDFLFGKSSVPTPPVWCPERSSALQQIEARLGEIYYYVFADEDIGCGNRMVIARAIVPSLLPITFGYLTDFLAHPRIAEVLRSPRLRGSPHERVNAYFPHFFP